MLLSVANCFLIGEVEVSEENVPTVQSVLVAANPACDSNPCKNGGECIDNNGDFQCLCLSDFTGVQCEQPISEYKLYYFNLVLVSRVMLSSFLLYPE